MLRHKRLTTVAVSAALVPALLLTACGSDDESNDSTDTTTTSESSEETTPETEPPVEEETETDTTEVDPEDAPEADGDTPEWANPVTTPGELLTTVEAGDVTVEVYQVGTAQAPKDGMFVDPDTNEPILKEGDDIVFVNYVITNNGDPIDLGSSLVDVSPRYADWKWAQGMDSTSDSDLYEAQGVNKPGIKTGTIQDPPIYTFGSGQTFSYGDNFAHQPGGEIEFEVRFTPVDASGDLVHDERTEATGTATIK